MLILRRYPIARQRSHCGCSRSRPAWPGRSGDAGGGRFLPPRRRALPPLPRAPRTRLAAPPARGRTVRVDLPDLPRAGHPAPPGRTWAPRRLADAPEDPRTHLRTRGLRLRGQSAASIVRPRRRRRSVMCSNGSVATQAPCDQSARQHTDHHTRRQQPPIPSTIDGELLGSARAPPAAPTTVITCRSVIAALQTVH